MPVFHPYDLSLLGASPEATRDQGRGNAGQLSQSRHGQGQRAPLPILYPSKADIEPIMERPKEYYVGASGENTPHTPFMRSAKGRVTIFVIAIVIIGVVVGGAVGGTVGRSKKNTMVSSGANSAPEEQDTSVTLAGTSTSDVQPSSTTSSSIFTRKTQSTTTATATSAAV